MFLPSIQHSQPIPMHCIALPPNSHIVRREIMRWKSRLGVVSEMKSDEHQKRRNVFDCETSRPTNMRSITKHQHVNVWL